MFGYIVDVEDGLDDDDKIIVAQEPGSSYGNTVVEEFTKQMTFLRKELDQKNEIIATLREGL